MSNLLLSMLMTTPLPPHSHFAEIPCSCFDEYQIYVDGGFNDTDDVMYAHTWALALVYYDSVSANSWLVAIQTAAIQPFGLDQWQVRRMPACTHRL